MIKRYLIIEAYTDANIGSGALVENTVMLLQEKMGVNKEHIRIMAHYPSVFENKYKIKSVQDIFRFPYHQKRLIQVIWLIKTITWMIFAWFFPGIAVKTKKWVDYEWADIVISVGAERINDKYIKNEFFSLFTYAIVKRFNKKMILAPSTYGPFLYRTTRAASNYVFKKLDLIYCRDKRSLDTIVQFKNINSSKIINTTDVAICQKWTDKDYSVLPFMPKRKIVGISVMKWSYKANQYETSFSNYSAYVAEMAKLSDAIIEKYSVDVILYPTNYPVNGCREDDVAVAYEIFNKAKHKSFIHYLNELPTPTDFKSMLSCSEINITTRMHACILSTGAYVPTISINYLFKLREYMDDLGLSDFSVDIEDFNHITILNLFDKIWNERDYWSNHLMQLIPQKKEQLLASLNRIDALLQE